MTEDEAKTKWCPFVRINSASGRSYNRCGLNDGEPVKHSDMLPLEGDCIGSACMAWRASDNEGVAQAPDDPTPMFRPAGYCGLAGKP